MQITVASENDYVDCTRMALKITSENNFNRVRQSMFATIVAELARNLLDHAGGGEIMLGTITENNRFGVEVIATDNGPGIIDVELAMTDNYSSKNTLGLGLPGANRLSDDFRIETKPGKGTTIRAIKWRG